MDNTKLDPHEARKFISHYKIFDYWKDKCITKTGEVKDQLVGDSVDVVTDYGEPCCWSCGKPVDLAKSKTYDELLTNNQLSKIYGLQKVRSSLQRCHIVPHALGGSDEDPSNLFLMCSECHKESPDTENPRNFLRWVYKKRKGCVLGVPIWDVMRMISEECEEQGKDVFTFDAEKAPRVNIHGSVLSTSSIVYSFVDACECKGSRETRHPKGV